MLQQTHYRSIAEDVPRKGLDRHPIEAEIRPTKNLESSAVFAALDRLEERILNSPRVPLTGKTVVVEEELLEQIDTIRMHLPEVIAAAQEIVRHKERLIQETTSECEQLRQQTAIEVQRVSELHFQDIERMREQVKIECQQIQDGADEYADRVLHNMEYQLSDILQAIQRGRQRLNENVASTVDRAA
jgi:hypothetical protein